MALTTVRPQGMGFNTGRRNLIINGAMQVAQRGTDIDGVANGGFCTDRFKMRIANTDNLVLNLDQSTDTPDGYPNSLKLSVGTVESAIAADEFLQFGQVIEGQNLQHLKWGTSDAETLSLSFWVKSSVTGTYAIAVFQADGSSSPDRRYYSKTYTISSANTWEYKTLTISPNTDDAIANDNTEGLRINWTLSTGSNYTSGSNDVWGSQTNWSVGHNASWITTSSATFFLTGVQLEVGENASDFEHRSFGEELALCQRYYEKSYSSTTNPGTATVDGIRHSSGAAGQTTTGELPMGINFLTTKRSAPTITLYDSQGNSGKCSRVDFGITTHNNSTASTNFVGENAFMMSSSSGSTGSGVHCHFVADAEL